MRTAKKLPKNLRVNARITARGIIISLNGESFPVVYPKEIWSRYPTSLKEILRDNLAYSSTLFVPQMLNRKEIQYATARPLSETFLYKNGIYDMPISATVDGASSTEYIKRFFNSHYCFPQNRIRLPRKIIISKPTTKTAIVPFSFGKESFLTFALCQELGIRPILVYFIEPTHRYEYLHKKVLMEKFKKDLGLKVYTVANNPGIFRYGARWNLTTELGWGTHTTDYVIMCLPFAHYFKASFIFLGNEQSCNDAFIDNENVLTYKAAYDQHCEWTGQQGLLATMLSGKQIEVASLLEPLYEIAETKILHQRYPKYGRYQMSCEAKTEHAKRKRWCQACTKCSYMYALCAAFNIDLEKVGFTENLFE